ncbi:MAG: transposase, partial [Chromatiaceae bacterium]
EEGKINTARYIAFLKQLTKGRTTPLIVIVDRAPFHQSEARRDFVRAPRKKMPWSGGGGPAHGSEQDRRQGSAKRRQRSAA